MKFRDKWQYRHWLQRNGGLKGIERFRLFWKKPRASQSRYIVASGGHGVAGSVLIKAGGFLRGPLIWVAASNAEKRGLQRLLLNPTVEILPFELEKADLSKVVKANRERLRAKLTRRAGVDPGLPILFFAGRISRRKGIMELIRMLEAQRFPCRLVLAGHLEKGMRLSRTRWCRVEKLGGVSRNRALSLMKAADLVCALSTDGSEDFGLLPREAIAVGTPVLMTRWGGYNDLRLPPSLDRIMIERVRVIHGRDGELRPDLSRVNFARLLKRCGGVSEKKRKQAGALLLRALDTQKKTTLHRLRRLEKAIVARQKSGAKLEVPLKFTKLAHELALRGATALQHDPNEIYPAALQLSLMSP